MSHGSQLQSLWNDPYCSCEPTRVRPTCSRHCTKLLDAACTAKKALSFAIVVGANEAARADPSW